MIVLRGSPEDCDTVANQTKKSNGVESFAPANFQSIGFSVRADRIRVLLPHKYLDPSHRHIIHGSVAGQTVDTICSVSITSGYLRRITSAMASSSQSLSARVAEARADGVQLLQLIDTIPSQEPTSPATGDPLEVADNIDELDTPHSVIEDVAVLPGDYSSVLTNTLLPSSSSSSCSSPHCDLGVKVGAISVGEVLLKTLQTELEKSGVSVEYKLIPGGAILLCAGQVIVRKENENDFVVEGPPCQAYFQIKHAIYRQFAFL